MDRLTKEQRKMNMQAVKSKGSFIESTLAKALWGKGVRYRKNYKNAPGKPDIAIVSLKIAIFCDSEFWHGKDWSKAKFNIKSNREFWWQKIERNIERDKEVNKLLKYSGWKVVRFWGNEIKNNLDRCVNQTMKAIKEKQSLKYSNIKKLLDLHDNTEQNGAFVTHYLQNINTESKWCFKEPAEKYIVDMKRQLSFDDKIISSFNAIRWDVPFPPPIDYKFTFIDLFAGIGGFRLAFQKLKGKCVFSSEIDKYAKQTYEANFGEIPFGDITTIDEKDIPDHDILLAGFPCQAFSIAGRRNGFEDTRGTLFFDIARIVKEKQPKAFFLENVKGLINHDRGKTLSKILDVLRNDLGYNVPTPIILNSKNFGVPQNRERIFIVGFRQDVNADNFDFPSPSNTKKCLKDIIEAKEVSPKYYLSTQYLKTLREHRSRHESKGNGFGYEIIDLNEKANAIVVGGMGRERNLIVDKRLTDFKPVTNIKGKINRDYVRRMTPREWARLQGYPDKFIIDVSDAQAYKQFGNSVTVNAIKAVGKNIVKVIL